MTFAKFTAALVLAAGVGLAAVAQEQPGRTRNEPPPAERAPKRPPAAKADAPAAKSELDGTWAVTLIETGGRPVNTAAAPDEFAQPTTFVIAGGRCEVKGVRLLHLTDFRVKTDPAAEPKQIDATMLDGPKQGETYPGIYAVDGDKLRICLRLQRTELGRPKGYSTTSGTTLFTFSLTRSKAAAVDPRAEVRFDDVLRSGKKLYLVLNGPLTKNLTDDLAPFAERLSLAVKTADRVKDKDVTVVLFRRFDAKTNDGILSGFTREQLTRYAAEGPARRIDKLAEHAWTPGRLPKDATPLPPEPAPPNAVEAGPELSARVVVRSDRVPPEPSGDLANARVGLDGRLELLTRARTPVRVVVTPSQVRVTIRGSGWSSIPPVQLGREGVEKEPPPRPRAVEVPPDGYVGLDTQAGQRVVITGRPSGADVHTGPHVWRLPPGRYRVEGEVDVTVGERPMTVRLEPTAFTIP